MGEIAEAEPVDPDWVVAAEICQRNSFTVQPWTGKETKAKHERFAHHTIYDAIKRGRTLAEQSK